MTNSTERSSNASGDHKQNIPSLTFPFFEKHNWDEFCFGDLFEIKNGLNKGKEYFGHGTPILNYMDVNQNTFNSENTIEGTVELTKEEIERYNVKNNDLFLTRTSETSEEIGLSSCYLGNDKNTVFSGFILRARPKKDDINSLFYSYYLRTPKMRNNIIKYSSITTRALINSNNLSKMKIKKPSIELQNKIAELFYEIDQKIELMEKKYTYFNKVLKYFLNSFFDIKNETNQEYKLKDFCKFKGGYSFKEKYQGHKNYSIPFYKVSDLNLNHKYMNKCKNTVNQDFVSKMNYKLVDENSILIAKLGEAIYLERKRITFKPCLIDNNLLACIPLEKRNLNLLYYLMLKNNISRYAQQTAVPSLSPKDIGDIKIYLPENLKIRETYVNLLKYIDKKIEIIKKEIELNKEFKRSLLSKMFC